MHGEALVDDLLANPYLGDVIEKVVKDFCRIILVT